MPKVCLYLITMLFFLIYLFQNYCVTPSMVATGEVSVQIVCSNRIVMSLFYVHSVSITTTAKSGSLEKLILLFWVSQLSVLTLENPYANYTPSLGTLIRNIKLSFGKFWPLSCSHKCFHCCKCCIAAQYTSKFREMFN